MGDEPIGELEGEGLGHGRGGASMGFGTGWRFRVLAVDGLRGW